MNKETYRNLQLANIDNAISLGENVIKNSRTLHNLAERKDSKGASAFFQDTMKYFSFSDTAAAIEFLPLLIKDFKNQLIEIKIANDKMLLEGGFLSVIDKEIAEIFLQGAFGQEKISVSAAATAAEEAIEILKRLKTEIEEA